MKKDNFFWVSYADLMTSMFFVMMMLFIFTVYHLREQQRVTDEILDEIKNVQTALGELDEKYFTFDSKNKRYKLHVPVDFANSKSNIYTKNSRTTRNELINAGKDLFTKVDSLIKSNSEIDYLIVIEGNTARTSTNYKNKRIVQEAYGISYSRALSLVNLWKANSINFDDLGKQCEIIIAGSGYFGKSREKDENKNRNFTIQVTSKVGKLIESYEK